MSPQIEEIVLQEFGRRYGGPPEHLVRAPGRVNLIGEHTDYNDGFVLPLAIDRATWIALRPRADGRVQLFSIDQQETVEFDPNDLRKGAVSWMEYPKGVAWALRDAGYQLYGWEGVSICDVPMGAGLSSSASFELATARAFAAVSHFQWDAKRIALLCQRAENDWVGVKCGVMDQMISAIGREGHAILIDCRDLATEAVPLPLHTAVVVLDTTTRRGLVESAYNERRRQCETAAKFFGVKALRDLTLERLKEGARGLDAVVFQRARHVVTENERTLKAAAVMRSGDAVSLGQLLDESHVSLRDDFAVSNAELDQIVAIAQSMPGCLGARMTGAGFGGCAIALVEGKATESFLREAGRQYRKATGLSAKLYVCRAVDGAEEVISRQG